MGALQSVSPHGTDMEEDVEVRCKTWVWQWRHACFQRSGQNFQLLLQVLAWRAKRDVPDLRELGSDAALHLADGDCRERRNYTLAGQNRNDRKRQVRGSDRN